MSHGDDARNLKWAVVGWITDIYGPSNPPLKVNSKAKRGLENNFTGALCCLSEWDWDDPKWVHLTLKQLHCWLAVIQASKIPSAWGILTMWLQLVHSQTFSMPTIVVILEIQSSVATAIADGFQKNGITIGINS